MTALVAAIHLQYAALDLQFGCFVVRRTKLLATKHQRRWRILGPDDIARAIPGESLAQLDGSVTRGAEFERHNSNDRSERDADARQVHAL